MTAFNHALAYPKIEKIIDLLKTAGGFLIDAQIVENRSEPSPENPSISINLSGEDVSFFVRNNGELTDAVHQIAAATLHLSPGDEDLVWFDVNHLRADRRDQLRRLAEDAVAHVRSTSRPYSFSPMLSCERRMLRQALASSGLKSASEGEGGKRCVVLYPEGISPPVEQTHSRLRRTLTGHESTPPDAWAPHISTLRCEVQSE